MLVKYTNRKGDIHYLKAVVTPKGATRYYIVKNKENVNRNALVSKIPDNYEFYEFPEDGRVAFRKKQASIFNNEEKSIVKKILKKQEHIEDFILDLEKESLMIYIAFLSKREYIDDFGKKADLKHFRRIQSYFPKIRIIKYNNDYQVQRFCNLSRYYGWITMETSPDLEKLSEKYFPHIGKESLLKFWIEGEEDC